MYRYTQTIIGISKQKFVKTSMLEDSNYCLVILMIYVTIVIGVKILQHF